MSDLTNVPSELVSNNAFVLIQVSSLFKITGMICKNAEFVNALDSTWFWIFSSDGFVIRFTGLLRLTGSKMGYVITCDFFTAIIFTTFSG